MSENPNGVADMVPEDGSLTNSGFSKLPIDSIAKGPTKKKARLDNETEQDTTNYEVDKDATAKIYL